MFIRNGVSQRESKSLADYLACVTGFDPDLKLISPNRWAQGRARLYNTKTRSKCSMTRYLYTIADLIVSGLIEGNLIELSSGVEGGVK